MSEPLKVKMKTDTHGVCGTVVYVCVCVCVEGGRGGGGGRMVPMYFWLLYGGCHYCRLVFHFRVTWTVGGGVQSSTQQHQASLWTTLRFKQFTVEIILSYFSFTSVLLIYNTRIT